MNYVEEFCDNIAILNDGHIVLDGEIREIKRSYKRDKLVIRSEKAEDILKAYDDCKLNEDGSLVLKMSSPEDKKQIMQKIASEFEVDEIRVYEPSMNDIFVEYTGDEKGGDDSETV